MTAAEADAALRAAGFVEEEEEAASALFTIPQHGAAFPEPLFLAWSQLVTLQQWAVDTEPRHKRSSALAVDTLQQALLAQQQRSSIVSLIWDCKGRPKPKRRLVLRRSILSARLADPTVTAAVTAARLTEAEAAEEAEAEAAYNAAVQAREEAPWPRFTEGLYNNVRQELQQALAGQAQLVNKLVHVLLTQRRLEAVEWPAS